jgi:SAM-dependent methyltransferase
MAVEPIDDASSYGHASIHYDMITDTPRTMAYSKAIDANSSSFRGKAVLDIGSGTGILSLFAARAGARVVYSIECTPIARVAAQIIRDNGFEDRVRLIHSRMESAELPEKVDIVVSEWMGYTLFFERMLTSVLIGRDRWLKPGGLMLPSHARLFVAVGEASQYRSEMIDFWDSVYGFNFGAMKKHTVSEVIVDSCEVEQVLSDAAIIADLDLHVCPVDASFFTSPFRLTINKQKTFDGFVTWFDVFFNDMPARQILSTSPSARETHWKQSWFLLENAIQVHVSDVVSGEVAFSPDPSDEFALHARITFSVNDGEAQTMEYLIQ